MLLEDYGIMFNDKKFVAVIPARGGSKGIKNKNIVLVQGKPLIQYTIDEAQKSKYLDRVLVSTDSKKIAEVSRKLGAEVLGLRPAHLATDEARTIDVLLYELNRLQEEGSRYDYVVLLQPTQPLRKSWHIDAAIERIVTMNSGSLVSVSKVKEHPILMRTIEKNKLKRLLNMDSTVRRQDFPEYYKVNGAIYINKIDENLNSKTSLNDNELPYVMDKKFDLDIDTPEDLRRFECILKKRHITNS